MNDFISRQAAIDAIGEKPFAETADEYDELKDWWAKEHAKNVPLSWDELKQMKGKPVWVEYTNDEEQTGWALIAKKSRTTNIR